MDENALPRTLRSGKANALTLIGFADKARFKPFPIGIHRMKIMNFIYLKKPFNVWGSCQRETVNDR